MRGERCWSAFVFIVIAQQTEMSHPEDFYYSSFSDVRTPRHHHRHKHKDVDTDTSNEYFADRPPDPFPQHFIDSFDLPPDKNNKDDWMANDQVGELKDKKHSHWPIKREAVIEGDLVIGGLMMVHERSDNMTCGPVMPQGGVQALETMLYTLDQINNKLKLIPGVTIGAHILDDCDKDTYGLEMAVDFIKGMCCKLITVNSFCQTVIGTCCQAIVFLLDPGELNGTWPGHNS